MPELPEVETVVRDLSEAGLLGREIQAITVRWPRILARPSIEEARTLLSGARIEKVRRRGKYIMLYLSTADVLVIHLRMTGQLDRKPANMPLDKHHHLLLQLDNHLQLRYRDPRKFGRFYLVADVNEVIGHLGPEPIDPSFNIEQFQQLMSGRRAVIKPLLLNQQFIAGLGNIYVDEALFRAGVHPQRKANTLTELELKSLFAAMRDVLNEGIHNLGTTLGRSSTNYYSVAGRAGRNKDNLRVFRRTGQPCPNCGTPIQRLVIAQRRSHLCPACQPL